MGCTTPAPRGTHLVIAREIADAVRADPAMRQLPSVAEVMAQYAVSRGVVLRAFRVLAAQGVAAPDPGDRWKVTWRGQGDQRPLVERLAAVIAEDGLHVGAPLPGETRLAERLGVSRPTVRKALAELEVGGILAPGGQGKQRTVRTLPPKSGESARPLPEGG
ncbi:GntR family transcriptional regulator [Streptomyces sp. NPDC002817]|uniref:GntR family transcriptional regulator n=1 Tax=Streptomyces sp. NPDC088357 TaxID=3154655 RepID=UPI0034482AE5